MEDFVTKVLYDPVLRKAALTVIAILIVIVLVQLAKRAMNRYVTSSDARYRGRKIVTFGGYVLAILALTIVYSDKLGGFQVALGVAGAGIAFALQEVIVSIAGWFAIVLSNFYNTGDRVQLGGIKGDVIDIGILRTTIMEVGNWVNGDLYNGRVVRVANSFVFKEPVFNYSGDFPFLWDEITIPVRTGSDVEFTNTILETIVQNIVGEYVPIADESWRGMVKKYLIEDARVTPMITMSFDESWITFTIRYVVSYKLRRTTKDRLFRQILAEISKHPDKVTVATAAMDVTLVKPATNS